MTKTVTFNSTLILGGTGMLAKASAYAASISRVTTLAARNPHNLTETIGAKSLVLDWNNLSEAKAKLGEVPKCDLIVSWVHEKGLKLIDPIESLLNPSGRSIRVHGCESANLEVRARYNPGTRKDISRQTVILGWINGAAGRRWLTHEEISIAVIAAIKNPDLEISIAGTVDSSKTQSSTIGT